MLINFRQGIVAEQQNGTQPNFLVKNGSGVDLLATYTAPTVITFAQGTADYLFQETTNQTLAWPGPFGNTTNYYLYWDINLKTGVRTFGYTTLAPVAQGTPPSNPQSGQHWFDTTNFVMNVFQGGSWNVVVRLFAGEVAAGTIIQYTPGTQVGINTPTHAGYILFDNNNNPVKKFQTFGLGEFITTESPLATQFPKLQNFKLEAVINTGIAAATIAQWKLVCNFGSGTIAPASNNFPGAPVIGITPNVINSGALGSFIVEGFVTNPAWSFPTANANLFCDATGNVTTTPPSVGSLQVIGQVISTNTILFKPQPIIIFE